MSKQWENDLKALYQQSRQELPSPELDKSIRVAAQKAIQRKSPNLKWYLSSAAVVLLAVNVVLLIYVPEPEMIEMPGNSSSGTLNKELPKAALPQSSAVPMMEPSLDASETQKPKKTEALLQREAKRSKAEVKKALSRYPASEDSLSESLKIEDEALSQLQELDRFSGSLIQGSLRHPENLPYDINRLVAGNPALMGQQTADSLAIYQNDKLILKMTRNQQGIVIEAYPEAQLWGVYAEWGQSNEGYKVCSVEKYLICDLTHEIQGGFENNRLIFIRWMQKYEP